MKRWQIAVLVVGIFLFAALILAGSLLWQSAFTHQGMMTFFTVLPILGIAAMLILGHYRFRRR